MTWKGQVRRPLSVLMLPDSDLLELGLGIFANSYTSLAYIHSSRLRALFCMLLCEYRFFARERSQGRITRR